MPRNGKSSVPCSNIVLNPYFGKMEKMVGSSKELRAMAEAVRSAAKAHGRSGIGTHSIDVAGLLASGRLDDVKRAFVSHMRSVANAPPPKPVLGPAPSTHEVYGRFGKGCKIIDLGSGNGMKLRKFTGSLCITAVEPHHDIPSNLCASVRASARDFFLTPPVGALLSSWMSLPQMSAFEIATVFEYDGCHGIPNHPYLLSLGAAHLDGDKVAVSTGSIDVPVYTDTPLLDIEGYEPDPGYIIAPSFAYRTCKVSLNAVETGPVAVIDARPIDLTDVDWRDVGYKWDGVAYELELHEGSAWLTNRAGVTLKGQYTCESIQHLCVHLELMHVPESPGLMSAVVLRVLVINGMVPPHCGSTLRLFAEKVRIEIEARGDASDAISGATLINIHGPPPYVVGKYPALGGILMPTDGIICRAEGHDFYCKTTWTIDITPDMIEPITLALNNIGIRAMWEGVATGTLLQYTLRRTNGTAVFSFDRGRVDKLKPTTVETVIYLCGLTTLEEDAALEGRAVTDVT